MNDNEPIRISLTTDNHSLEILPDVREWLRNISARVGSSIDESIIQAMATSLGIEGTAMLAGQSPVNLAEISVANHALQFLPTPNEERVPRMDLIDHEIIPFKTHARTRSGLVVVSIQTGDDFERDRHQDEEEDPSDDWKWAVKTSTIPRGQRGWHGIGYTFDTTYQGRYSNDSDEHDLDIVHVFPAWEPTAGDIVKVYGYAQKVGTTGDCVWQHSGSENNEWTIVRMVTVGEGYCLNHPDYPEGVYAHRKQFRLVRRPL